jgi:hypothetical protein
MPGPLINDREYWDTKLAIRTSLVDAIVATVFAMVVLDYEHADTVCHCGICFDF